MAPDGGTAGGARQGEAAPGTASPWRDLALGEALVLAVEIVVCGVPLWFGLGLPEVGPSARAVLPVALAAATLVALMRLGMLLAPIARLLARRRRGDDVEPEALAAAERAMQAAPREAALVRLSIWAAAAVVLAGSVTGTAGAGGDVALAVALAAAIVIHALGAAGLRALLVLRVVSGIEPALFPEVEGIRWLASGYRLRTAGAALGLVGLAHAMLALDVLAFVDLGAGVYARLELAEVGVLVLGAGVWLRSFRRRTRPIDAYLDAALRPAGARGPARDDPRAARAFVMAQALPYRLAGYGAFWLALAGVTAVALGRTVAVAASGFSAGEAARLLAAVAAAAIAFLLLGVLALRRGLAPLLRHIGSRHALPVPEVRAQIGLGPKLMACFLGTAAIAAITCALYGTAPETAGSPSAPQATLGAIALAAGLAVSAAIALWASREVAAPLGRVGARSEEMARGELARPVPPAGEADEIGRLTVAFEEMRRSLRDRLRSTESINIDLEREVRRRTEALERKNVELGAALAELRRAQDTLVRSEKMASMGRLVAGIAHEINNPVNAVLNSVIPLAETMRQAAAQVAASERLDEAVALLAGAEEMVSVIQRGAVRAKGIVQALHNYSRGDESHEAEVHLPRSIEDSLDILRHRLRHARVVRDVDAEARILGFPGQIDQVLVNLVTNAAQALGDAGGTIHVVCRPEGDRVMLAVGDDGPGIPPDVLPRIFDPFFTTKPVGEGSGLGLAIVHGIVERHGGRIDVDSAPGRGTTFRMSFPRAPIAASKAASGA